MQCECCGKNQEGERLNGWTRIRATLDFSDPGSGLFWEWDTEDSLHICPQCGPALTEADKHRLCGRITRVLRNGLSPEIKAADVLHHIDSMYPAMWKGVAKSARLSIKNTIIRAFS